MNKFEKADKKFIEKFPIKKIITDSDFDGLVSAAMLRNVYPDAEIMQSKASDMHEGKMDKYVDQFTLITDLRYINGCGLYFDHHISNKPKGDYNGSWQDAPSAARVIYDFFKDNFELSRFEEIVDFTDKFDMGHMTLEDYKEPDDMIKFAFIFNRNEIHFNLLIIELLARLDFEELFEFNLIQNKVKYFLKAREEMADLINENSEEVESIVFVNLRDQVLKDKINGFDLTAMFPHKKAVIIFKPHASVDKYKIRFYKNNFYEKENNVNLLKIAKVIEPISAGGHVGACGLTLSRKVGIEGVKENILEELKKQL